MKNKGLLAFEVLLLVAVAYFVIEATDYNRRARLVPILIGVPVFLLILFQIAVDHVPSFERFRPGRVQLTNVPAGVARREAAETASDAETSRRELTALAWVIGLGIALTLFGYYLVIPLFLITFLRFVAALNWRRALISTALTSGILYAAFVWFLRVDFYPGLLIGFG